MQGEPPRSYTEDDAPRLLADVSILREYFIARDEKGEPHALPEEVVITETMKLEALVTVMGMSSDEMLAAIFSARRYGADGQLLAAIPSGTMTTQRIS